ncbi:TonB system transport protein ExbD [Swaminathania salitolerans]|uniref:Biopolymer transport protein ExbD n=1 Tax=Swaminathania salitolerans TaxID=182838 RepID=A0A511BLM1_9PROT|nr:TonB system transport protein ExbD [Swaminathania salitolerans]GBQ10050.1 ExbD/TolR proton channel family protein [Swaminathania salitolerans LMG 21291]GEL01145.1 biopolymer transport protein ExbD [Swaminathania salitolerans]
MALRMRHADESAPDAHELNVTPLIDVMLVLLVIFMVTAPLSTVNVPVDLPASTAKPAPRPNDPVFVTIKADHGLALGDEDVANETLTARLMSLTDGHKDERIFLRADKTVDYETLMKTMDLMRKAGFLKVALVNLQGQDEGDSP